MKEFKDLVFERHQNPPYFSTQAMMFFDNGYAVSVVTGHGAYGDYEMAVGVGESREDWHIVYDTPITDDVLGYLTPDTITEYMRQVQELPKRDVPVHNLN